MSVGKILTAYATLALVVVSPAVTASDDHSGQDFAPSASPDGREVVYYSYRGQSGDLSDLYIVDLATGIERQLTNTPGYFEIEPQWSQDGDKIYFAGGPSMKELDLFSIRPDGTGLIRLETGDGYGPPQISSKGDVTLMWRDYEDGSADILTHNFGSNQSTLLEIELGGKNQSPEWAGKTNEIIFSHRAIDDEGKPSDTPLAEDGIYHLSLKSNEISKLSQVPLAAYSLLWGPDGNIYFMANPANTGMQIFRMPQTGGIAEQVTPDEFAPAYFPALSADGQQLLFSGKAPSGRTRIFSMPLAGGTPTQIMRVTAE